MKCCDCIEIAPEASVTLQHVSPKAQIVDVKGDGARNVRTLNFLNSYYHVKGLSKQTLWRSGSPETPGNFLAALSLSLPFTCNLSPPCFSSSSLPLRPKELSSERIVHSADPLDQSVHPNPITQASFNHVIRRWLRPLTRWLWRFQRSCQWVRSLRCLFYVCTSFGELRHGLERPALTSYALRHHG